MDKKRRTIIIVCSAITGILVIILISSLLELVNVKTLSTKGANAGKEGFISFGKTKKKEDNKNNNGNEVSTNETNDENQIDMNAFVENILLRDQLANANKVDNNIIYVENVTGIQNNNSNNNSNNSARTIDFNSLGSELDPGDLMMLTDLLNRADYNPFIAQSYSSPDKVDVFKAFYTGAGDTSTREQNLWDEYKEVTGREPKDEIVKVRVSYIEELLNKRLGLIPENWRTGFNRVAYSDRYNAYYFEHSDTNYITINVVKGYVKDNTYTLVYKAVHSDQAGTVTLTKQGDDYKFVSNYIN